MAEVEHRTAEANGAWPLTNSSRLSRIAEALWICTVNGDLGEAAGAIAFEPSPA